MFQLLYREQSHKDSVRDTTVDLPEQSSELYTKGDGRKHEALRPQKPLRLIRDGEVGGRAFCIKHLLATLHHHSAVRWADV